MLRKLNANVKIIGKIRHLNIFFKKIKQRVSIKTQITIDEQKECECRRSEKWEE